MDNLRGHCLCGETSFECTGKPKWCVHCHCESCRRNTGSGYTTFFGMADGNWDFTGENPGEYQSTSGVTRYFCKNCGSPVAYRADKFPDEIHFYVAQLDDPNCLEPTAHVHFSEKLSWVNIDDNLPKFAHGGSEGAEQITVPDSKD